MKFVDTRNDLAFKKIFGEELNDISENGMIFPDGSGRKLILWSCQ